MGGILLFGIVLSTVLESARDNTVSSTNAISLQIQCRRSQRLLGLGVRVVNDYADTFGKLRRFLTDFKWTISQNKVFKCVYTSNSNNLKIWKSPYLKKKSGVRVVVDYADIVIVCPTPLYIRWGSEWDIKLHTREPMKTTTFATFPFFLFYSFTHGGIKNGAVKGGELC